MCPGKTDGAQLCQRLKKEEEGEKREQERRIMYTGMKNGGQGMKGRDGEGYKREDTCFTGERSFLLKAGT